MSTGTRTASAWGRTPFRRAALAAFSSDQYVSAAAFNEATFCEAVSTVLPTMMKPMMERRQFGRRSTSINAWILAPGRPRLSCLVRNLSPKGAFLELNAPEWLPFRFELRIDGDGKRFVCELRHALSGGVGVTFCEEDQKRTGPQDRPAAAEVEQWTGQHRPVLSRHRQTIRGAR